MKGILLAGGSGTRLGACTWAVSKQLLPVFDKPMVYYPLSVLMLAGVQEILLVTNPHNVDAYRRLLGDGSEIGVSISYFVQDKPRGIADAFLVCEKEIENENVCLILGDNIFYGQGFSDSINRFSDTYIGAQIFGYPVTNPSDFGVVTVDSDGNVLLLEEKPKNSRSNLAVPGLYFYDSNVVSYVKTLKSSMRGELEITDLNKIYLGLGQLNVEQLGRGMAWLDTGTPQGLLQASQFVETIQSRQGLYIACIEEVAWRKGFIDDAQLARSANKYASTEYGDYLLRLLGL